MSKLVIDRLEKRFGDAILHTHDQFGDDTAVVDPKRWREVALFLRDDGRCSMDHFIDLTAVDYLNRRSPRFEVVLHLRSTERLHRIRVKAPIDIAPGEDTPHVDSLVDVWKGANWFEREAYDMFGVIFDGHPDLRRLLMYPEFVGYPLRKDYVANHTQPLIPYREGVNNEKLAPFGVDEGMPFGRQTHDQWKHQVAERRLGDDGRNVLGFEEEN